MRVRLETVTAINLYQVRCDCSTVVLSYYGYGYGYGRKVRHPGRWKVRRRTVEGKDG